MPGIYIPEGIYVPGLKSYPGMNYPGINIPITYRNIYSCSGIFIPGILVPRNIYS